MSGAGDSGAAPDGRGGGVECDFIVDLDSRRRSLRPGGLVAPGELYRCFIYGSDCAFLGGSIVGMCESHKFRLPRYQKSNLLLPESGQIHFE